MCEERRLEIVFRNRPGSCIVLDRSGGFDAKAIFIAWQLPLRGLSGIVAGQQKYIHTSYIPLIKATSYETTLLTFYIRFVRNFEQQN